MPNPNKQKGNRFEREVAEFLTELYKESFLRIPTSGAFIGKSNLHRKAKLSPGQINMVQGDISPPDSMTHLKIECKSYKDFPFHRLLTQERIPLLDSWIAQTEHGMGEHDICFLIFKINLKGAFVCYNYSDLPGAKANNYSTYGDYIITEFESFFESNADAVKISCSS